MATKSSKRGNSKRSTIRKKPRRARASVKGAASTRVAQSRHANSKADARPSGKRLPAWNEIEIDEQRENAGRQEPAFLSDGAYAEDDLAEEMGEEFVMTATSGEQAAEDFRNQDVPEELGGPFVETSARTEFAYGADPSNPKDAEPAAFPTVIKSLEAEEVLAQAEEDQEERPS
jgi:hypothetical protein